MKSLFTFLALAVIAYSCNNSNSAMKVKPQAFNQIVDGKEVRLYELKNTQGIEMTVTNWGARIVELWIPDKDGNKEDIVLGYDKLSDYLNNDESYYGSVIGRCCNRIAGGTFTLNDIQIKLAQNSGLNSLHGGTKGFSKQVWDVKQKSINELEFSYISPDMEEGYPGELVVKMNYRLTNYNELIISYEAKCDKPTVVNLTNHSYFNLHGAGNGTILDHLLQINADYYTPIDSVLIPTGEIASVDGTPFDFRKPTPIGERINLENQQLKYGKGYDLNYVLTKSADRSLSLAAIVFEPQSGRKLSVFTDQPGIQFYSGNFLKGKYVSKKQKKYEYRTGFCLETQYFPDSPNKPKFPSVVLQPDQVYSHTCVYQFTIQKNNL